MQGRLNHTCNAAADQAVLVAVEGQCTLCHQNRGVSVYGQVTSLAWTDSTMQACLYLHVERVDLAALPQCSITYCGVSAYLAGASTCV